MTYAPMVSTTIDLYFLSLESAALFIRSASYSCFSDALHSEYRFITSMTFCVTSQHYQIPLYMHFSVHRQRMSKMASKKTRRPEVFSWTLQLPNMAYWSACQVVEEPTLMSRPDN